MTFSQKAQKKWSKNAELFIFAGCILECTLESPKFSVKVLPSALVLPLILVLVLPSKSLAWWSLLPFAFALVLPSQPLAW